MLNKRKQVYLAVAGSVGIHLLVLFAWACTVQWFPAAQAAPSQPPEPIKLQVVNEESTPTPSPVALDPVRATPTPPPVRFADTADLPESSHPPKDARFQSSRNTEAASELFAAGDAPIPTQKGKKIPNFAFDTHPYTPGDEGDMAGQNVPQNMPPVRPETAPPPPRPMATPIARATPALTPVATPSQNAADPRDIAMVTPQSLPTTPTEAEPNPYDPSFRPPVGMTEPPRPTPVPRRGGFQPLQQKSATSGSIAKIGTSSISSEATPTGRYKTTAKNAIQRVWYQYYAARPDVSLGTVKVHFEIDCNGKVHAPEVVANSGNDALMATTMRAIQEAHIPPAPDDVAGEVGLGLISMDIQFNSISDER